VTVARVVRRYFGLAALACLAALLAVGYMSIRRDVTELRELSKDNILWTATQMEVELLRFHLSVAGLQLDGTPEALAEMRERFDMLWSRIFMMGSGRIGDLIRRYDENHGAIVGIQRYMQELDPVVQRLQPDDHAEISAILKELETFQRDLRLYTLRAVRGNDAAATTARGRIESSAQAAMLIGLAAVLISLLALALILKDNRRQREIADLSRRLADEADRSNRTKSRFLGMMSHELRNPLNGLLGPLALLGQSDLPARHMRLVEQAQQSGRSVMQLLGSLLDHAELRDGGLTLRVEPFRLATLAATTRDELRAAGALSVETRLRSNAPDFVAGDLDRLRMIFVHLTEYVLDGSQPERIEIVFDHSGDTLVGDIAFEGGAAAVDWKLDLLTGLNEIAPDQVSSEALRPVIVRGLVSAMRGVLTLIDAQGGRNGIRVAIPAPAIAVERVRLRIETRSAALAAIYQAALRSDRVSFVDADDPGPVDVVLIDAASMEEAPLMRRLRERCPQALFVSLGAPDRPESFDDVVRGPADMGRLRSRILATLSA